MSLYGYNQGLGNGIAIGNNRAAAVQRDANDAVAEWKDYAATMKAKLEEAEKLAIRTAAMEAARDAQQKALRDALTKLDPKHPLLKQLPDIGGKAMVDSFAAHGYAYDLATETLRKV